jgi:acetyltransferase-like isoleucine patch superfamily enzyme
MSFFDELKRRSRAYLDNRRRAALQIDDPTVMVAADVLLNPELTTVGSGTRLKAHVRLLGRVSIGRDCVIREYALLHAQRGSITLGEHCSINDYAVLYGDGGITLGRFVRVAAHTVMVSSNHVFDDPDRPIMDQGVDSAPITIEDDVWIGASCCILAGITIGRGSVIGAGSVVTKSIPAGVIAAGTPARVLRTRGVRGG